MWVIHFLQAPHLFFSSNEVVLTKMAISETSDAAMPIRQDLGITGFCDPVVIRK
jgi:hypothetical protein